MPRVQIILKLPAVLMLIWPFLAFPAARASGADECAGGWSVTIDESQISYRNEPARIPEGATMPRIPPDLELQLSAERYYWKCFVTAASELVVAELGYGGQHGTTIRIYSQEGRLLRELNISEGFKDLDVSPEGLIAVLTPGMGIVLYDSTGRRVWHARDENVRQAMFDARGRRLACLVESVEGNRLRVFAARNGLLLGERMVGDNPQLFASPDLELLALRYGNPGSFKVDLLDFDTMNLRWSSSQSLAETGAPMSLQWGGMLIARDGGYVAFLHFPGVQWSASADFARPAEVVVLDLADGRRVCSAADTYAEGMRLEWHQGLPVLRIGRYVRNITIQKP